MESKGGRTRRTIFYEPRRGWRMCGQSPEPSSRWRAVLLDFTLIAVVRRTSSKNHDHEKGSSGILLPQQRWWWRSASPLPLPPPVLIRWPDVHLCHIKGDTFCGGGGGDSTCGSSGGSSRWDEKQPRTRLIKATPPPAQRWHHSVRPWEMGRQSNWTATEEWEIGDDEEAVQFPIWRNYSTR